MKNLYRLTFLLFCCVLTNSYSQTDTTAFSPASEPSVLEEYSLRADNGKLVFSSAGKEGPAAVAIRDIVEQLATEIAPPNDLGGCSARMMAAVEAALDALD